ncbi:uncharacterized protein LOC142349208 [Convolutriloba macropyga]|uniref:uncharacterized protein LOC142349208 n=1 Tax=Convolutriloba macropyga TaxID=536237 RepID=UPI003F51D45E
MLNGRNCVPRIDFSAACNVDSELLFGSESSELQRLTSSVSSALEDVGFFILNNSGVGTEQLRTLKRECIRFFGETSERKLAYKRTNPKVEMFGYTAQENSTEIFDINRPCDIKETFEFSLRGDDPVPTDEWQKMREELSRDFSLLYTRLILIIARALKLDNPNIITSKIKGLGTSHNRTAFRAALYPEVKSDRILPGQLRCGLHCDYGCLTFIYKSPFERGLSAKERGGDFIDVYGLEEGDLIVNAGECLQMMTGDLIRASPHQVGFPQPTEKGVVPAAFSLIVFGLFDDEAEIETLPNIGAKTSYPMFKFGDYFTMRLHKVFVEGKGLIDELLE